ncbi:hypothetical protein MNBD_NITROSPIRAE01-1012 [hydrothermal vent metagenome]|uniref:Protochlamydia outer membrane protein domain-containing protein n=1 Tax=hydrothermal vent metagenome TaxID=652676 RepID=A0A3B1D9R2_9ZZZZ
MKKLNTTALVLGISLFIFMTPVLAKSAKKLDLGLEAGWRIDQLNWSISGVAPSGNNVNILSELRWENLLITQVRGNARLTIDIPSSPFSPYARASLSYGEIYQGENQDSDYNNNNRQNEFSRSNNNSSQGNVLDASFGLGLQFSKKMPKMAQVFNITPLLGYSYHQQNLRMTDGLQTIDTRTASRLPRPIPGLDSRYATEWHGPWIGIDFSTQTKLQHTFFASFEYHWLNYNAEANWNLRPDLAQPVSFTHSADGSGILASLGWEQDLSSAWMITIKGDYLEWKTKTGIDHIFASDGSSRLSQRLNRVTWESYAFSLGLQYRFQ